MHFVSGIMSSVFFCLQGWYIITYALGIYLLNLFIAFLTPKIDPAQNFDYDGKHPDIFLIISECSVLFASLCVPEPVQTFTLIQMSFTCR